MGFDVADLNNNRVEGDKVTSICRNDTSTVGGVLQP
jgi:hypothetical protein